MFLYECADDVSSILYKKNNIDNTSFVAQFLVIEVLPKSRAMSIFLKNLICNMFSSYGTNKTP
jgi:hypothetical protein